MTVAASHAGDLFWITSRAAGVAALVLASAAVCVGLLMGARLAPKGRTLDLRATHEVLSLTTLAAIAVHGLSLLGDTYMKFTPLDIAVPFAGHFAPLVTSAGIVAGWGLAILGLGYYVRDRIGAARWRRLHRYTALAWLLGLVHAIGEGTDAGHIWFLVMIGIVVLPALGLLALRVWPSPTVEPRRRVSLSPSSQTPPA